MNLPENYKNKFSVSKKKIYSFQDLASELELFYGKGIWGIFRKVGFTETKIREAHKICQRNKLYKLPYLIGVIKKLI